MSGVIMLVDGIFKIKIRNNIHNDLRERYIIYVIKPIK